MAFKEERKKQARSYYKAVIKELIWYVEDAIRGSICDYPTCEVISVEYEKGVVPAVLDMRCGIDAIVSCTEQFDTRNEEVVCFTFALRFQRDKGQRGYPFNSFSINPYEEKKRKRAIAVNGLYPTHTVQVYMDRAGKDYVSFGIVRTDCLYDVLEKGDYEQREGFKAVYFEGVVKHYPGSVKGYW